ncbi:MAG TPA: 5-formyltetrahydrofolate cyclo-ligase [Lapillicoccus sp.]|nr:5-formyltetrahydrofolate cyclo-ligase [Lapillicoccus sp.]
MTVDPTSAAKSALRRRVRSARRERLPERDVEAEAAALADAVTALVEQVTDGRVCRVAAYESRPTEPPTHLLVQRLAAAGYEVVVPITLDDLDLDWKVSGTPEPLGRNAIREALVIVSPGLAVDRAGHRLGQGGGSYDRALARCRADAVVVTLLFDDEVLAAGEVPVDAHDRPVDRVVTTSGAVVRLAPA